VSVPLPAHLPDLALALADAARSETLPRAAAALPVTDKGEGSFDPVTEADRAAEAAMRALLVERVPGHGIVGEEHGTTPTEGAWRWVLDPIDGTRAFVAGFPTWTTLVGLLHRDRPVLGLIDAPAARRRWCAWTVALDDGTPPGLRATWDEASPPTRVRPCRGLQAATLSTTDPALFTSPARRAAWQALSARCRTRRLGGDALAYALLASGRVDLVVECGLQPYDIAALVPVVEAAGGVITTWSGGPPLTDDTLIAAGDARVHVEALAVLRATGAAP